MSLTYTMLAGTPYKSARHKYPDSSILNESIFSLVQATPFSCKCCKQIIMQAR